MGYYGGDIDQSSQNSLGSIYGQDNLFGMDKKNWVVNLGIGDASSSAKQSDAVPWTTIALAAVAIVGLLAWKSKRSG